VYLDVLDKDKGLKKSGQQGTMFDKGSYADDRQFFRRE